MLPMMIREAVKMSAVISIQESWKWLLGFGCVFGTTDSYEGGSSAETCGVSSESVGFKVSKGNPGLGGGMIGRANMDWHGNCGSFMMPIRERTRAVGKY